MLMKKRLLNRILIGVFVLSGIGYASKDLLADYFFPKQPTISPYQKLDQNDLSTLLKSHNLPPKKTCQKTLSSCILQR